MIATGTDANELSAVSKLPFLCPSQVKKLLYCLILLTGALVRLGFAVDARGSVACTAHCSVSASNSIWVYERRARRLVAVDRIVRGDLQSFLLEFTSECRL